MLDGVAAAVDSEDRNASLQNLTTTIFVILINSMPDERTPSAFTWFNSPLHANQSPHWQLIDMVQIGHGAHVRERKEPYPPVVKFQDIDQDLERVSIGNSNRFESRELPDESESEEDAVPGDSAEGDTGFNVLGEDHLEVDEDISLDSAILKDLLSTKPLVLTRKTNPLAAQKKDVDLTEQPDWDF
ncbi:hypothetical protein V8E55_008182 [Tylopilus felleus]